jgi:NTP pyrophosphatase (non-canonical NTP hydrolase)
VLVPIHDHADEHEERDAAQLGETKLSQRAAILGSEIGEVVGELVQPINARTRGRKRLR